MYSIRNNGFTIKMGLKLSKRRMTQALILSGLGYFENGTF